MRGAVLLVAALGLAVPLLLAGEAAACHPPNDLLGWKFFKDVNIKLTYDTCVGFQHSGWATTSPSYIETLGAGVCAGDVNGDGRVDLYLTNGRDPSVSAPSALFRNAGDADHPARFTNSTSSAGVGRVGWSTGCVFGDYDNDGDADLYVTGRGASTLYRNKGGGTFDDVTAQAGVANDQCGTGTENKCWGSSAAFLDHDRDGDLDLYVVNYIDFAEGDTGSLNPRLYRGQPNTLYRNDGPDPEGVWRFADVSEEAGVEYNHVASGGRSLGVAVADYDDDGWPDLLVANDEDHAALYRNRGDGTFANEAPGNGLDDDRANMGVDWADYDGDGRVDAVITHFSDEEPGLWSWGGTRFADEAATAALLTPNDEYIGWGTNFFDLDNDMDWDVWISNGHPNADRENAGQAGLLYQSDGGQFRLLDNEAGEDDPGDAGSALVRAGRGAAFVDFDNDGDVDIVAANNRGNVSLLRNNVRGDGSANSPYDEHHWVVLRLKGVTSPCEPWGAKVSVTAGGKTLTRFLGSGGSYQSGNDPRLHFGLGSATSAEVTIRWPSGATETRNLSQVDRVQELREAHDAPPPAPGAPEASVGADANVAVRWKPVSACDVRSYEVHVGTDEGFAPSPATRRATVQGRDVGSAVLTGLPDNAQLHLRVVAIDAAGQRTASPSVAFTTPNLAPPPVEGLSASVVGAHEVELRWLPTGIADFARYEVHGATQAFAAPDATTLRATLPDAAAASARLEGLSDAATHHLRVVVVDTAGLQGLSEAVTATLPDAPPPAPPLDAPPAGVTAFNVTLTWPASALPADFAAGEVHASEQAGFVPGADTRVVRFTDRRTQHVVGDLDPGAAYSFRLRVFDTAGASNVSAEVRVRTLEFELPAVHLQPPEAVGPTWARLAWSVADVPEFRGYEVHVSRAANFTPAAATLVTMVPSAAFPYYNVSGLAPDTLHHVRVVVTTTYGAASPSNEVEVRTPAAPAPGPAAAPEEAPAPEGPMSPRLPALAFEVLRVEPGPGALTVHVVTNRPTSAAVLVAGAEVARDGALRSDHALRVAGLRPGAPVTLTVLAADALGGTARAEVRGTPTEVALAAPPRRLVAEAERDGGVLLRWDPPADLEGVARLRVYRAIAPDGQEYGPFERVAELDPHVTSLRDDPPPGVWAEYRVASVDDAGQESRVASGTRDFVRTGAGPAAQSLGAAPVPGPEGALLAAAVGAAAALARRRR